MANTSGLNDDLKRKVEDLEVEGWKIKNKNGANKVTMMEPDYGSFGPHALIFLLTVWFTLGLGNVAYAIKRYYMNSNKQILRSEQDESDAGTTVA